MYKIYRMSLPDSSLTALKLCVTPSEPTNSDKYYYDIPLDSVNMGSNTILIPPTSDVVKCFKESTLGTFFTVYIESSYDEGVSIVESNNFIFVTNPITTQISLSDITVEFGDSDVILADYTTTNGKLNLLRYFITDSSVAALSDDGKRLIIYNAGSTTIYAKHLALGAYSSAVSNPVHVVVSPIAPTFTFGGKVITDGLFTIPSQNFGDPHFRPVYPTSNSDGSYIYESSDLTVATAHPTTGEHTINNAGTTTITIIQVASRNYTSGFLQASFTVNRIAPIFTFDGKVITDGRFTIASKNVGDPHFRPPVPSSNSDGSYIYESSDLTVATAHPTTGEHTINNAGTTTITIIQVASRNYTSGFLQASFTVNRIAPIFTFDGKVITDGRFTIASKNVGDPSFIPTYPISSNTAVAYSYESSNTNFATVDSTTGRITIKNAGTTTITIKQAADRNYMSGSAQATLVVNAVTAPTFTFGGKVITDGRFAIASQNFGDPSFIPKPSYPSSSNTEGAYSYTSTETHVATVEAASGRITIVGAGTTTITLTQAAAGNYISGSVQAYFTVNPIDATFSLNDIPIMNNQFTIASKNFGDTHFTPTYPKSNSLGEYSYASSETRVATVDIETGLITIKNKGTTIISELQAADGNYKFGSVQASFTVNPIDPTFSVNGVPIINGQFSIAPKNVGDPMFAPTYPISNSLGAYSYESCDMNVATVESMTGHITIKNAGTAIIIVKQAADGNYNAGSMQASFVVSTIDAFFTFDGKVITDGGLFTIPSKNVGEPSFIPTYPIPSNKETACIYESSNTNFATVDSTTGRITIKNAGTTTITIKQVAAGNYKFISVQASFTVNTIDAVFTFNGNTITNGQFSIAAKNFGDAPFTPTPSYPSSSSTGAYSYTSSNTNFATVDSTTGRITIVGAGTTTVTLTQAAAGNYRSGSVIASFVVNPIAQTFSVNGVAITNGQFTITSPILGDTPLIPPYPSSNSTGAYSYTSSNTTVATVNATGAITLKNVGTTTITVSQAAAGNYKFGSIQASLVVNYKWSKQGQDIDGEAAGDKSGYSVSLSADGSLVAIGAPYNNSTNGSDTGQARVYKLISGVWTKQDGDIDGSSPNDQSGYSVSISGDGSMVAIGAPNDDGNGTDCGHVRVFKLIGGVWTKQGGDIDGEAGSDNSGISVSLSYNGSIVAIGAPNNDGAGSNAGQVRVYKLISGAWIKQGGDIDGAAKDDKLGTSVSLSYDGLTLAVGAPMNNTGGSDAGQVRVYKLISGVWTKQGGDINGAAAGDNSGTSVSISSDGLIVAVGAPNNDIGGSNAGQVTVYKLIGSTWTKQGLVINGEAAGDESGTSVSLSSDGLIVAIGAPKNNGGGTDAGQVRVYKYMLYT